MTLNIKESMHSLVWLKLLQQYTPTKKTFYIWIILCTLIYGISSVYSTTSYLTTAEALMLTGPLVWKEPWRLLSHIFVHGSWLHLIMTSIACYQLAHFTETLYGSWRFQTIFIISSIFGGIFSIWYNPYINMIGISDAILGLMGALLAYTIILRAHLPQDLKKNMIRDIIVTILLISMLGIIVPNINNVAHIGGFVAGFITGLFLTPRPSEDYLGMRILTCVILVVSLGIYVLYPNDVVENTYIQDKKFEKTLKHVWQSQDEMTKTYKDLIAEVDKIPDYEWTAKYQNQILDPLISLELDVSLIHLTTESKKKIEYNVLVQYIALKRKEADAVKNWVTTRDLEILDMLPKFREEYNSLLQTLKETK